MRTHHHGTKSFIDFMSLYLQDHPKRCPVCGNKAQSQPEWRIEKRGEDGLRFVHACPECGSEEDLFLTLHWSTNEPDGSRCGGRDPPRACEIRDYRCV